MDNRQIEGFAVNAVKDSILSTEILDQCISENDKEPSWDGFIYVYKSKIKKKDNLKGRVPVQVKGRANNNFSSKITFSVEVSDLNNYLRDGGVIYFVVRIHKADNNRRKIYYETLTPVKLNIYLKEAKGNKTKTINLKEFPLEKNDIISIVLNFLNNRNEQTSFVNSGFISVDEIQKIKSNHNLSANIVGYGKHTSDDVFASLFKNEIYLYATSKETNASVPFDTPFTTQAIIVNEKVLVGGESYYDSYELIYSGEGKTINIGDSISLLLGKDNINTSVCFSKYLRKATKDMQFILDAITTKSFSINTFELRLDSIENNHADFISTTQKQLAYYQKIIDLLSILNVSEDINTNELTTEEKKNINILIKAIVDKEEITINNEENEKFIGDIRISAKIVLKLVFNRRENGKYIMEDFFNSDIVLIYKDENGNNQVTSLYSALTKEDYITVSNINYEKILESYKDTAIKNPMFYKRANMDLLTMLHAFDEKPNKKLLIAAKDIASWLLTEVKNKHKNIFWLNYLQIIKRGRAFIKEEEMHLLKIAEDSKANEYEKTGAYLLLENQLAAEVHFEKLKLEEKTFFKTLPIYKFWKDAVE